MVTLGLDNALQITGWSILKDNKLVKYGTFKTKNSDPVEKRLGQFWKELNDLYQEYEFEYLFFEDCQKQQNAQTFSKLSMVKATILLWCYFNKMPYNILGPSHWRSVLKDKYGKNFGKSRAEQKKAAQQLVREVYGVQCTEDESDSICLHLAGIQEKKRNESAF